MNSRCPKCNSENVRKMVLPYGDEEYLYCFDCKKVSVITKVKIDEEETRS